MPVMQIDAAQVRKLLPVKDCIQSVREAMIAFSKDNVHVPLRSTIPIEEGKSMLSMPGACKELGFYGVKLVSLHADNARKGLPTIQGAIDMGHIIGEIGQVASDDLAGRLDDKQMTLYKSLGITAQDLFPAAFVYRRFLSLNSHSG